MENDIKDTVKKLEEAKKRQEKIERILLLSAGLLIILVFAFIGINIYYKDSKEKVSEPKIVINNVPAPSENVAKKPVEEIAKPTENKSNLQKSESNQQNVKESQNSKNNTNVATISKQETKVKQKVEKEEKKPEKKVYSKERKSLKSGNIYYTIQVGAFKSKENAEKFLKANKLNGFIKDEAGIYRVFIGKFKSYKEASAYLKKLPVKGFIRKIKFD
jgi:cell division septation protein DedD